MSAKSSNVNIDLNAAGKALSSFVKNFHTIIFFLLVSGGLFAAILSLLSIITVSSTTSATSDQIITGTFDEATVQRIQQQSSQPPTPGSRKSPFVE